MAIDRQWLDDHLRAVEGMLARLRRLVEEAGGLDDPGLQAGLKRVADALEKLAAFIKRAREELAGDTPRTHG